MATKPNRRLRRLPTEEKWWKSIFEQYTDHVFDKASILEKLLFPMLFNGFAVHANPEISIYMSIWKCIISRQLIEDNDMKFRTFVTHEDDFIMLLQLFCMLKKYLLYRIFYITGIPTQILKRIEAQGDISRIWKQGSAALCLT